MKIQKESQLSRRGAGILLAVSFLGVGITLTAISYTSQTIGYYGATRSIVDGYRAKELARSGIEAALLTLGRLPEELLFTLGILASPPQILLTQDCDINENCTKYYVSYSIQPEDGKLNLNHLVGNTDEMNVEYYTVFSRLFEALDLEVETLGAIVDWIDENNFESTGGAEKQHYESLSPPRKIKNAPLYSLSEAAVIKGFQRRLIYDPRVPVDFEENQKSLAGVSDLERQLLQKEDWVLGNNVTVYLPHTLLGTEKVSINAARYHVLLSLSEAMGRQEILSIFKLKGKGGGYIKSQKEVEAIPELQRPSGTGALADVTLAKELFGVGTVSGTLKMKSRFYRVTGIGFIAVGSDTKEKSLAVRRVWGIWDKDRREFIYYSED